MTNWTRTRSSVLFVALALGPIYAANAATVVQPDARITVSYEENGGLTGSPDTETFGVGVDAALRLSFASEVSNLSLVPRVRETQFDKDQPDREEQSLQLLWNRSFQTASSDLLIDWSRQDLLTSELREEAIDFDEDIGIGINDSGIVDIESTRNRLWVDWDFAKQFGPRSSAVFEVGYVDLDYARSQGTSRVPFSEARVDLGWRWIASEIAEFTFTVGAQQFESDNGRDVDALRADFGYNRSVSERFDFYAGVGLEKSENEQFGVDLGSESNATFVLGGQRTYPRGRFRLELLSDVLPNSSGIVSRETGVTARLEHGLTQMLKLRLSASSFTTEEIRDSNSIADRDFTSGRVGLSWRMSPRWSLEADYSFSRQDFDSDLVLGGETEDRSRVTLSLRYQGLRSVPFPRRRR